MESEVAMESFLQHNRPLPSRGAGGRVVQWHVFRSLDEAAEHARHILLGEGQRIVGGWDVDSVGMFWWVGVEVDDLARWGNQAAVNKHAE